VAGLPYVIIHRIQGESVQIVADFHAARNRRFEKRRISHEPRQ
jgi:hypothetical protein